jgi:hypothetical protein
MLVAAMLFIVGWLIGRMFTVLILGLTSFVTMFTAMAIFTATYGFDILHVLITLGYLTAHQSGYLLGAYCSGFQGNN